MVPRLFTASLFLVFAGFAHSTPCPLIEGTPESAKEAADWIVEGRITAIQSTGSFRDCEVMPMPTGPVPVCSNVDKPEHITLTEVRYMRGGRKDSGASELTLARKAHCFSGKLSSMNSKPELQAFGRRVRFYGNDIASPQFVQAGYFWAEVVP